MSTDRVLVIGANGMLGYAVSEYFERRRHQVTKVTRSDFDIASTPIQALSKFLSSAGTIVNCAGVIKPRIEEMSVVDVIRVNAIFPRNLAKLCQAAGRKCFQITTDCVYSGEKGRYTEEDCFDAEDLYGMTKNAGEPSECMVLRTSIVGEEKGTQRSLLEWARSQRSQEVKGFTNHWWNGVTTVYLAEIIETIMERELYQPGVFHLHSNDVNKFELLTLFDKVYDLDLHIEAVEWRSSCDRRLRSVKELSHKVSTKSLHQQLEEMRRFFQAGGK